jgi:primosomal protein N' (replication factor Y)
VKVQVGKKDTYGIVLGKTTKPTNFETKSAISTELPPLPKELVKTLEWVSHYYATPLPIVVNNALPAGLKVTRRLQATSKLTKSRNLASLRLTSAQQKVVKSIQQTSKSVLLQGETGSGKTLIYRELAKKTLANNKSVLLLTPEIGLTSQLAEDLNGLTEHIFVTHSQLTASQRHTIWLNILQQKQPVIVIGPRSALFMPIHNLGLIVVDEAHETAYKQDVSPRYQAQSMASTLAQQHGAKLVFGTATPRVQDRFMAEQKGKLVVLSPFSKYCPNIQLIDQSDKSNHFKQSQIISSLLLKLLKSTLTDKHQSLLYVNRRGTAPVSFCSNCNWVYLCDNCAIPLTLHHDQHLMRCHQCGLTTKVLNTCPECAHVDITYRGIGTKAVVKEISRLLPQAVVKRFDGDSQKGQKLSDLYTDIHLGKIDIIVGTQAITRGLDLPGLSLVGVVNADSELLLPDFSASERSFQLLYQVIGRVGRESGGGNVIIQTYQPANPILNMALNHDYENFYKQELLGRKQHGYPPFKFMLSLIYTSINPSRVQSIGKKLINDIQLSHPKGIKILGPTPAFYEKRGNQYRWLVIIKSSKRDILVDIASQYRSKNLQIDIDPINLLY